MVLGEEAVTIKVPTGTKPSSWQAGAELNTRVKSSVGLSGQGKGLQ